MGLVWQCGRCGKVSGNYETSQSEGHHLPENWHDLPVPIRGSQGARSRGTTTLCDTCDDDLYRWLHDAPAEAAL